MATPCPRCATVNRSVARFCLQCNASLPAPIVEPADEVTGSGLAVTQHDDGSGPFTRTLLEGAPQQRAPVAEHALPSGTLIEGFRIEQVIGQGGFGIVYLASDLTLERQVAIKEYLPLSLAGRTHSLFDVSVRTERHRETFDAGLKSFVNEARLLARFDHPALLKVLRFWTGNRTAYMAMPWYEGPTLKAALAARSVAPTEAQVREWLDPLLDALDVIHQARCYHRDISPDNILLTRSGPVLLDFGAARRVITDMTQALTAVLKPDFAPIEQYGGVLSQGAWTDLYALAGVVHYAITGRAPVGSAARVVEDTLQPLAVRCAGQYSPAFLRAIDAALTLRPEARPRDVAQFRRLLDGDSAAAPVAAKAKAAPTAPPTPAAAPKAAAPAKPRTVPAPPTQRPVSKTKNAPRTRTPLYGLVAAMLLAAGGSAWWWIQPRDLPASVGAVGTPSPALVVASRAAASPAPAHTTPPATEPVAAPVVAPVIAVASVPTPDTAPKHDTGASLIEVPTPARPARAARPAARTVASAEPLHLALAEPAPTLAASAAAKPARCGEIVQKSTLESLNGEEIAYLKKACR